MINNNLVSICIPVYNGAQFIRQCLDSAIGQSYENIEILIVDDGSTDESINIIKAYQQKDSRIRIEINEINLGLVGNWERCIALARGAWIKFLFQDDWMEPDCVAIMMHAAIKNQVDIVFCDRKYVFESSVRPENRQFYESLKTVSDFIPQEVVISPNQVLQHLNLDPFLNNLGEPNSILFTKSIYQASGGFNPDLVQLVDNDFNIKLIFSGRAALLPLKLINFRIHNNSSSTENGSNKEREKKVKFIEPLILYHELLWNEKYKYILNKMGRLKGYYKAVYFYTSLFRYYGWSDHDSEYLTQKYPKLKRVFLLTFLYKTGRF